MTLDVDLDYSLLSQHRPPIAGPGAEVMDWRGPSWCGYCGYTGRCAGPTQQACPERHGWHRWLETLVDRETCVLLRGLRVSSP